MNPILLSDVDTPPIDDSEYLVTAADSRHRGGQRPLPPKVIILHATGGTNSLEWLTTHPLSEVSSHLLISKDGTVHRLVEDAGVAYHAGVSTWARFGGAGQLTVNYVSLGVELENLNTGSDPYPQSQIIALARAVYRWNTHYGWIPMTSHAAIAPGRKIDPAGFPWGLYGTILDEFIQGSRV